MEENNKKQKEGAEKSDEWKLEQVPTQYETAFVKGNEMLDANMAIVMLLNNTEKILKIVGNA